jgi:predicted Zn-dependent protease
MLDTRDAGAAFECGTTDAEKPGRAALDKLLGRLEQAAALPIPLKVAVVRRNEANAVALPGGHIYVFRGLVVGARNPDELAGVIAHELGHVAHRDGTRSVLQAAGLSFLFGMLLGDFTGGGVVVIAAKTVMQSAYSREVEAAADAYGVELMTKVGGDVRAFASILDRIAGAIEPGVKILLDHPETKERVAAINAAAATRLGERQPLLSATDWAALKRICG